MTDNGIRLVLTPTQVRLFQERAAGPGPRPLVVALELDGAVDADRLDEAWQEIQRRHPFLRLRIDSQGPWASNEVRAMVRGELPGALANFQNELDQILAMASRPRDFGVEGPAEAVLLRTGPEASVLICSVDHLAIDGWSFGLIAREWSALYNGQSIPPVPDPVTLIEKYNESQKHGSYEKEISDLVEEFDGAQPFPLPHSMSDWAFQQVDLPRDVAKLTRANAAKQRATAFTFGLATLGRALSINHAICDSVVSSHVANRWLPQSQHIACAAYDTIPIRLAGNHDDDIASWTKTAKEASLRALRRQQLPFSKARQALSSSMAPDALSRLMINVDEHPFLGFVLPNVQISEAAVGNLEHLGTGLNAPLFSTVSRPWPAGITVSFRETWDSLQLYVHYGQELGHRGATMLLARVTEGLALLTDSNQTQPIT